MTSVAGRRSSQLLCGGHGVLLLLRIGGRRGAVVREAHVHLRGSTIVQRRGRGLSGGGSRGVALVVRASPAGAAAQPATKPRRVAVGWSSVGAHERRCLRSAVGARAGHTRGALTLRLSLLSSSNDGRSSGVVVRVVQERLDVGLKERVECISDAVLLGQLLGTGKRDPNTLEMHGANLDNDALLFIFENTVSLAARHAADVEQLGAVDHVVVVPSSNTDTTGVDLEAERALILPERSGDTVSSGERQLGRVLRGRGVRGRREVRGAIKVAVRAVPVHEVGRRVAMRVGRCVRTEVVAAISVASVLSVVHHHAIDAGMVGSAVGSRGGRGRGNVVSGTVGIAIPASVLRVGVVAIRARAAAVDGRRRIAIGRPARAVSTVDGAGKRSVRVSMMTRVVVVGSVVSVSFAVHGAGSGAWGATGSRSRHRAGTDGRVSDSSRRDASVAASHAGRSGRVSIAAIAVTVVERGSCRHDAKSANGQR